jgi:predicted transcriptional regulator
MAKESVLHIIVGGDFDKDFEDLVKGRTKIGNQPENAIYLDSFEQLNKLLSPKKLDLLTYLAESQLGNTPESITAIAKGLARKQEAISRDVKQLSNLGLVLTKKAKQTVYAIPKYRAIEIKTVGK